MPKKKDKPVDPNTIEGIKENDLIGLSRTLLQAMIDSTDMMNVSEMTPEKLKEAKVVLGYLNATNSVMKTKIQVFRMTGLQEKADALREMSKRL